MSELEDIAVRFQVYIERLKTGTAREFNKVLQDLQAEVDAILARDEVSDMSRRGLERLIRDMRVSHAETVADAMDQLMETLQEFAGHSFEVEADALLAATTVQKLKNKVEFDKLWKETLAHPMSATGDLLAPWLEKLTITQFQAAENTLRRGHAEGWTNKQIKSVFTGTRANRYTDGILPRVGRSNETIIRTAMQHVNSVARMKVWHDNDDVVKGYEWVSTLDKKTSDTCRSLDRQTFKLGEGPLPPIHPNCRSTTIAVLDSKYDIFDEAGKRASATGPVAGTTSYYEWLKSQSAAFQDSVIGPTRGALLRNGGLDAEEFGRLQLNSTFDPLTLEQLRRLIPLAFKRAGV